MAWWVWMWMAAAAAAGPPDWTASELRGLLGRAQAATRAPSLEAQNQQLLELAAAAFRARPADRVPDVEQSAQRILRRRDPDHPRVKQGQWLNALLRQFYADAADRCAKLAKFSRERSDRAFFEAMARQTRAAADQLAADLQLEVEGLEGFAAPLPVADGDPPYPHASSVRIGPNGAVNIDGMDRVTFRGHRPPEGVPRTAKGAVREIYSALLFFNRSAKSFAKYDRGWAKKQGNVRAVIPARFPAVYLNEVARGAKEAGMRTLRVMVMTKRGELRELPVALEARAKKSSRRRRKKKSPPLVKVSCSDEIDMTTCAQRIVHAREKGRPWYQP